MLRTLPLLALLTACAGPLGRSAVVRHISFHGNGGFFSGRTDGALREAMGHPKPRGLWPFRDEVDLDREILAEDRLRVAVWYGHRGYFDARLVRWEIREVRPARRDRPPVVKIVGVVEEGAPSPVTSVTWTGLDEVSPPLARRVRAVPLREGGTFDIGEYGESLEHANVTLEDHSFAHADISGDVLIDRGAHTVAVTFDVDPGPSAEFGETRILGAQHVPESMIRARVVAEPGEGYSLSDLEATQRKLYGMQTFSVVEVLPQIEEGATRIPVTVRVQERRPRSVALGGGVEVTTGRQEALASARFGHDNLFHKVVGLDLEVQGGYAVLGASVLDPLEAGAVRGGPVVIATGRIGVPDVPIYGWQAELELSYTENIEEAYRYRSPSLEPSVSSTFGKYWTVSLGYEIRYHRYLDLQIDPGDLEELAVAPDLVRQEFWNGALVETLLFDQRNDVVRPTHGQRSSLAVLQAGPALGGDFNYAGTELDLRSYHSIRRYLPWAPRALVLAGRAGGGWLVPYGDPERAHVPYAERLKLGGSSSVRGWLGDHLGPYVCDADGAPCASAPGVQQPDGETVPIGGLVSAFGSVEIRKYWGDVGAVAFVDLGMVWEDPTQIRDVPILPTLGTGGRYQTPIGPIRFDVAVRTDDLPMFRNEPRLWFHLGLGEAF